MIRQGKKVMVAMSGGVDSSVTAALLKKQGYEVTGVFMLLGNDYGKEAAEKTAKKLDIEFLIFDFQWEFRKLIINYFLSELAAGRTPNSCVVCNPKIKFGLFLRKASALKADFIATGHYAGIKKQISGVRAIYRLFTARDKDKDQSYFLYGLNQGQLSRIIFPLSSYTKKQVFALAKKLQLPYRRQESFDLCFIHGKQEDFLKKHLKSKAGKIMSVSGEILGTHQDLSFYTIGQRANIGGPGPFYVVKKDARKNILYVSNNEKDLYKQKLWVGNLNWLNGVQPTMPIKVLVKIRYRSEAVKCILRPCPRQKLQVIFEKPQRAITAGQSAVFYKGKEVIGGGIIE